TREQPVGGFARRARGAEDRAVVLAQHGKPTAEIIGVAHGGDDAERGAEEGAAHFGIGSGGSRLEEDTPLPPTEPDVIVSHHPALRACMSPLSSGLSCPA